MVYYKTFQEKVSRLKEITESANPNECGHIKELYELSMDLFPLSYLGEIGGDHSYEILEIAEDTTVNPQNISKLEKLLNQQSPRSIQLGEDEESTVQVTWMGYLLELYAFELGNQGIMAVINAPSPDKFSKVFDSIERGKVRLYFPKKALAGWVKKKSLEDPQINPDDLKNIPYIEVRTY